jgi:ring-1,2-phenylacetyl-CoA epoxidase subunit PaaC
VDSLHRVDSAEYALRLGDDALVLCQRLCEWSTCAPELEEDVALTNIALDLLGQARSLLSYAGQLGGQDTEDDLAYWREPHQFRNVRMVETENGDFARTMVRQLLFSTYQHGLYSQLQHSTDQTIAGVAAKAAKESKYHLTHAAQWTVRLGDGTQESHRRAAAAVEDLWPYTAELFEPDDLTARLIEVGVAADLEAIRIGWEVSVRVVLAEATLSVPKLPSHITGGRRGMHGDRLGQMLAEMQWLHRSHPGATW